MNNEKSKYSRFQSIDEESLFGVIFDCRAEAKEGSKTRIPIAFCVCQLCSGRGFQKISKLSSMALSDSDLELLGQSFMDKHCETEHVNCVECDGKRVIPILDQNAANAKELKAWIALLEAESFQEEYEKQDGLCANFWE